MFKTLLASALSGEPRSQQGVSAQNVRHGAGLGYLLHTQIGQATADLAPTPSRMALTQLKHTQFEVGCSFAGLLCGRRDRSLKSSARDSHL